MQRTDGWGIRPGFAYDIDQILRLEELCFVGDRLKRRSAARLLKSPSARFLLAVEISSGLVGGYALLLFRSNSRGARLYSLAVSPGCRGVGLGGLLLAAAEAAVAAAGAIRLTLEVRGDNPAAITLYEKSGYRMLGVIDNYYEDGAAARRYGLDIPTCKEKNER